MESTSTIELNAFVPARDFKLSKQFFLDLGFTLLWGLMAHSGHEEGMTKAWSGQP